MAIAFYTLLKGESNGRFAHIRNGIGSAGKAREAATGLLMAIWAKIVRSIFFFQILRIYLFLIHFTKYQNFRKFEQ